MININNYLGIQPNIKSVNTKNKTNEVSSYHSLPHVDSSSAMTSYGKAFISTTPSFKGHLYNVQELFDKIEKTNDSDTISVEDAVTEFQDLGLTDNQKSRYILACTFEIERPETIINKKALLLTKSAILFGDNVVGYEDAIRTALNNDTMSFDSFKFDSLFNVNGQVKRSAALKPQLRKGSHALRDARAFHKLAITNAMNKSVDAALIPKKSDYLDETVDVSFVDIFTPIGVIRSQILDDLENLKESKDVSDDLYDAMRNSLEQNNFNMMKVYQDHYSLLKDCETIDDVKNLYPEMTIPEKPTYNKSKAYYTISNRMSNEDFDKISIDILKQNYIEMKTPAHVNVLFENSSPTTLKNVDKSGMYYSRPSENLKSFIQKSMLIASKNRAISKFEDEKVENFVQKHAMHEAGIWDDYKELTKGHWFPIKLINSKAKNPEISKYKTDKLVDMYLFNLYKSGAEVGDTKNPLEEFDDADHLSPKIFNIINNTYISKYKEEKGIKPLNMDFENFKRNFDKEAIGNSIEHMEKLYTNVFFGQYWNRGKVDKLKDQMQNSYNLLFEKVDADKKYSPKIVTEADVEKIISNDVVEYTPQVSKKDATEFMYMTFDVKNQSLKERCQSCVNDIENVDMGYFSVMYDIIQKSYNTTNGKLDEDKAQVLIDLHDKYMTNVLNSEDNENEDEFVRNSLKKYTDENGNIDYRKANNFYNGRKMFQDSITQMIENGQDRMAFDIERCFIRDNQDYESANTVIGYYNDIPEVIKNKFVVEFETKSTNRESLMDELKLYHDKIASWNFDNDEEIILDKDKIPQKVVIEKKAKDNLWNMTGQNIDLYDDYWSRFKKSATRRTGDKYGSGIKRVIGAGPEDYEIKIKGKSKKCRMYTRPVTDEDRRKYEKEDGIKLKYVFCCCDDHL